MNLEELQTLAQSKGMKVEKHPRRRDYILTRPSPDLPGKLQWMTNPKSTLPFFTLKKLEKYLKSL